MHKNPYEVLGVSKEASPDEINKAYRELVLKYHPDRNPEGTEKFKEVQQAFEILNNPEKRRDYDRFGAAGGGGSPGFEFPFGGFGVPGGFPNPEDLIRDIFTRRPPAAHAERGVDVQYGLDIDFAEAVLGCKKELDIRQRKPCDKCDHGAIEWRSCQDCGGTGQRTIHQRPFIVQIPCPRCKAKGKIITATCPECGGSGYDANTQIETVSFDIPAGVDEGTRIRLQGKGDPSLNGTATGDAYVQLHVRPHPLFNREDEHLFCTVPVSYTQLVLGDTISLPTIKGEIQVAIPPGTQSGTRFLFAGYGTKDLSTNRSGDLFVVVEIEIPRPGYYGDAIVPLAAMEREDLTPARARFQETILKIKEMK